MNFADIENRSHTGAMKANDGPISIDEMVVHFHSTKWRCLWKPFEYPIINPIRFLCPMVVGGKIVPRPMMYIALTYNHRLIDGREAKFGSGDESMMLLKTLAACSLTSSTNLKAESDCNAPLMGLCYHPVLVS
ncbi:hypothetical protein RJ641_000425 [Dillenia turbinata]|uniref:dihydrolipoyllysine-residue succinyltransferase n=1 Tax=Dillenia turbinata TaxID=194707 RepID=A0AAN8ZRH2_9MAGN